MKVVYIGVDVRTLEMATLAVRLRWPDVHPLVAASAWEGIELVECETPNVVLLYPDFTDMSLGEAIREIRRFSNVGIIVLSKAEDAMEVVTALEEGADYYVRWPCNLAELMARTNALLRRTGFQMSPKGGRFIKSGGLSINPATYEVFLGDRRITLTSTEFQLLHLLAKNRGTVVAHQTLESALWGEYVNSERLVKKYVQRLRSKLGDNAREPIWIVSVHGVGYRFIGPPPSSGGIR